MTRMGKRLLNFRKYYGYSPSSLAKALHVPISYWDSVENGKIELNYKIIIKLSELWHISADDLLGIHNVSLGPELYQDHVKELENKIIVLEKASEVLKKQIVKLSK